VSDRTRTGDHLDHNKEAAAREDLPSLTTADAATTRDLRGFALAHQSAAPSPAWTRIGPKTITPWA
jgi:hypothetical protein